MRQKYTYYKMKQGRGFTIIETLLSVAMIAFIAGIGIPIYQSFQNRNDLHVATVSVVQSLRRAQILSQAVDGDVSWGLYIQDGSIILYKGTTYSARDTSFDEVFETSASMTVSGTQEYNFARVTGVPESTGTTILTSVNDESRTIVVNSKGMINY